MTNRGMVTLLDRRRPGWRRSDWRLTARWHDRQPFYSPDLPADRPPHAVEVPAGHWAASPSASPRADGPRRPSTAERVLAEPITPHGALVHVDPEPWPLGRRNPAVGVPDGVRDQLVLHRRGHRLQLEEERVGGGDRQ